eukprot:1435676-Prorocentrum_lima.AAC.1
MTSSLVGSEMCIRDRMVPPNFITFVSPTSGQGNVPALTAQVGQDGGDQAVSYTHLTLPTICSV